MQQNDVNAHLSHALHTSRDARDVRAKRTVLRMQLRDARRVPAERDVRWAAEHHQHEAVVMYI